MRETLHIWRSATGFTLLEVMVAVAIISMSFVALMTSQSQSLSVASISRFERVASMLARQKLAELRLAGFDELNSGSGEFEEDFSDYHWQTEVNEASEDETGIAGTEGMLKLVELRVSRDGDEDTTFTVRTLVMAKIKPAEEKK